MASGNNRPALASFATTASDRSYSFAELARRSNQVANALHALGGARGDRLLLMLPNVVETWETILACMKLGVIVVPATPQLTTARPRRPIRARRGASRRERRRRAHASSPHSRRVHELIVGSDAARDGRASSSRTRRPTSSARTRRRRATDPLLLYFTSGTTAKPKLVLHTHASYPVGHLSTMYWIGLREDDCTGTSARRVGEARVEQRVRAVERRRDDLRVRLPALRREARARDDRAVRRDDALRAADRLAHADRREPRRVSRARCAKWSAPASRSTPRSSRACGTRGASRFATGTARPRRPRRSAISRPARTRRVDGPSVAGLPGRPARLARRAIDEGEIALPLTAGGVAETPLGLMVGISTRSRVPPARWAAGTTDGRRRRARPRWLHHLRRAGGRRVQELRLSHQPVRDRERPHRASAGRGGGRSAEPGRCPPLRAEGLLRASRATRRRRAT
jgi:hypothetical protein